MHSKNKTTFKTLDRIALSKKVEKVESDSDGIWVWLADGYNFAGQSAIRGDTVRNVLDDFAQVEEGAPY